MGAILSIGGITSQSESGGGFVQLAAKNAGLI